MDRVHRDALAGLDRGDRETLLRALEQLTGDRLATPAETPATARRARQSQK